jgi:tetratricopeptide (TPR) repeat protein
MVNLASMKKILILVLAFSSLIVNAQPPDQQLINDELLAAQLLAEGQFEKAAVIYEEIFEKNPTPLIYNNYLRCLLELGEYRKAERLVNSQMRLNPGRSRFEVDLGMVYTRSGDLRKARRQLENLIKDVSLHPISITELANAFLFRDFDDYALQTYLKGREALGVSYPFNLQIAAIHQRKKDYQAMMSEYVELAILDNTYLEQVQGLIQDAINDDPDYTKTDALRRVLLQGSQSNPSQTLYAELLLWLSVQQRDFDMAFRQARALDRRLQQDGRLVLEVAKLSVTNKRYDIARQSFEYIISMGDLNPYFLEATVGLLDVKYLQATTGYEIDYDLLREVEREYESTIDQLGIHAQTVSLLRNLARLKAFYLNNTSGAEQLLRKVIDLPGVPNRIKGECRIELGDVLLLKGDLWDAHLLYALVDKTFRDDPLAHEARYKNARLSFFMGEFKWAKAQLDVLKAATSRLIANDAMALSLLIQDHLEQDGSSVPLQMYARAQMHTFMNNSDLALSVLDSLTTAYAGHRILDNVMMNRANIYMKTGRYNDADQVLADITRLYPSGLLAADALFQRARLQESALANIPVAMELYQELLTAYPGSLNAVAARNRFRFLRGDKSIDDEFFYDLNFRP